MRNEHSHAFHFTCISRSELFCGKNLMKFTSFATFHEKLITRKKNMISKLYDIFGSTLIYN